jgi:hypothetical protein
LDEFGSNLTPIFGEQYRTLDEEWVRQGPLIGIIKITIYQNAELNIKVLYTLFAALYYLL